MGVDAVFLPYFGQNGEQWVLSYPAFQVALNKDLELARQVMDMDDVIDDLFDVVKNELIDLIRKNADNGSQAIDLLMIAKYFERIGDHAQNIAECVEKLRPPASSKEPARHDLLCGRR